MTSTFVVQGEEVNQLRATEVARQDSGDDAGSDRPRPAQQGISTCKLDATPPSVTTPDSFVASDGPAVFHSLPCSPSQGSLSPPRFREMAEIARRESVQRHSLLPLPPRKPRPSRRRLAETGPPTPRTHKQRLRPSGRGRRKPPRLRIRLTRDLRSVAPDEPWTMIPCR